MPRKFETKSLSEAAPKEVRAYATTFLGIPTDGLEDGEVMAKVQAAQEGDTIFVAAESELPASQAGSPPQPADGQEERSGGMVGSLGRSDPRVTITLHAEERDGVVVNRHKEVGVNGVVWLLKRGMSITIPYRVFEALKNAERHVITHTSEGEVREQVVRNTPYNVEVMPPQEEIDAWHAKTDALFVP